MDLQAILEGFSKEVSSLKEALLTVQAQVPNPADLAALSGEMNTLRSAYSNLQASVNNPAPAQVVPVAPTIPVVQYLISEQMPMPDKFSGSKKNYTVVNFKLAVRRIFENIPNRYPDDASKIKFIGNLLEGSARKWLDAVELSTSPESVSILTHLDIFWLMLEKHFGHKSMPFENEVNLLAYKQGKNRISDFNVRFKQLASALDFNETALCAIYIFNLNEDTLNFLIRMPPIPRKLDELMERCAHLDSSFLSPRTGIDSSRAMQIDVVSQASHDKKLFCRYCKERSHMIDSCTKLARRNSKSSSSGRSDQPSPSQGKGPATRL